MATKLQKWVDRILVNKDKKFTPYVVVRGIHPAVWASLRRDMRIGKILPAVNVEVVDDSQA